MLSGGFQALIVPSSAEPSAIAEANALTDRGVRLWQAGRRSEAVAAFARATQLDAHFAVPWHNRGAVFLIEGQFTEAISDLARAVELAPAWTLPRTHLAQAYLRAGETQRALAASAAARALDPTLPDVRVDLRAILKARADFATAVAARRRTFLLITLTITIVITILTAGIGFATLALPIYRFALFAQAARQRDAIRRQLRDLDAALQSDLPPALPLLPPMHWPAERQGAADAPYVAAAMLPAISFAELNPRAPAGTGYRRTGWAMLLSSLILTGSGTGAIVVSVNIPTDPNYGGLSALLEGGLLSLIGVVCLVLACIAVAGGVLVGAVAAFRRGRAGWGIAILTIGVLGVFCALLPAQVMVLFYLLAMPPTPRDTRLTG